MASAAIEPVALSHIARSRGRGGARAGDRREREAARCRNPDAPRLLCRLAPVGGGGLVTGISLAVRQSLGDLTSASLRGGNAVAQIGL